MAVDNNTLSTRPPSPTHERLQEKFDDDIASQAQRLDDVAKLLLTVELAVPGLFATALKLISGDKTVLAVNFSIYSAFGFWFLAVALALMALMPKHYNVDRDIIRRTPPHNATAPLSIEAYFDTAANYKYRRVVISTFCFLMGLVTSIYSIL